MEFTDAPLEPFGETFLNLSIPTQLSLKTPLVFRLIRELQKRSCLPRTGAHHAELAFEEAITNAMIHGNRMTPDKRVRVTLCGDAARWGAIIEDEGDGFKPEDVPDPNDPENLLREAGRGILLMDAYLDELKYNRKGNRLRMVRHVQLEPEPLEAATAAAPAAPLDMTDGPVSCAQSEGFDVVQVNSERVSEENAGAIRDAALEVVNQGKPVMLDLGRVAYCSSVGLTALVQVYKAARAKNVTVVLSCVQPAVLGILKTAHLLQLFDGAQTCIVADRAAGVQELKRRA
jgi:serine/threonine-protein kinase RsbW